MWHFFNTKELILQKKLQQVGILFIKYNLKLWKPPQFTKNGIWNFFPEAPLNFVNTSSAVNYFLEFPRVGLEKTSTPPPLEKNNLIKFQDNQIKLWYSLKFIKIITFKINHKKLIQKRKSILWLVIAHFN